MRRMLVRLHLMLASMVIALPILGPAPAAAAQTRLRVVSTVAPITNIVRDVGGESIELEGPVLPGVDSHAFEP